MAGPGGQSGDASGDRAYNIIWAMVLVFGIGVGFWFAFDYQIKLFFIALRTYQFQVLNAVLTPILQWVSVGNDIASNLALVESLTPEGLTLDIANDLSVAAGVYTRYIDLCFILGLFGYLWKANAYARLKQKHNMRTLKAQECKNWHQIAPVLALDLVSQDIDVGPWAMSMTPLQFAKKYQLMKVEALPQTFNLKQKTPDFKITLLKEPAEAVFSAQLGRTWRGADKLPLVRRAIFTVLAARADRDSKTSRTLIYQLAESSAKGSVDYTGIDALCHRYLALPTVKEIVQTHAYELTVIISMLQLAREDGVVASADFLWVKPIDRRLWYVLNNVGRQTIAAEVGGIFCHWQMEAALKQPLSVPIVAEAVQGLEMALSETIYTPTEAEKKEIKEKKAAEGDAA